MSSGDAHGVARASRARDGPSGASASGTAPARSIAANERSRIVPVASAASSLRLRREPRQADDVELVDLRRPVERRADGEIGRAVAQRDELALRVALRERSRPDRA